MPKPIKLSRTSVQLFLECPKCFYKKIVHKVSRPNPARYSLNLEIDKLLKQEFDHYRHQKKQHPIQKKHNLPHFPALNTNLNKWRHNFTGAQHQYKNLLLYGSLDDLWFNPATGEHSIVDYKATSSHYQPSQTRLDSYNTQLSFYSWLLQHNGLKMSDTNYILLCNAYQASPDTHLEGSLSLQQDLIQIPNQPHWITDTLEQIIQTLTNLESPSSNPECLYCSYLEKSNNLNKAVTLPF